MRRRLLVAGLGTLLLGGVAGVAGAGWDFFGEVDRHFAGWANGRARSASQQTAFQSVEIMNRAGQLVGVLDSDSVGDGIGGFFNRNGSVRIGFLISAQDAGQIYVAPNTGRASFVLDGIGGLLSAAGDLAETFPANEQALPGSVVVIDALNPGALRVASRPYDRRVAGVVAGAKDYRPGITLRAMEPQEGRVAVTLTGTAYCLASNVNGAIRAGDLLTSSSVPGHAMKVTDHEAARGAILGKAMEDLKGERGHVMILASLQ